MRPVVFFCMPEPGHFRRLLALIRGVTGLGLSAHVFTHVRFREEAEAAGGRFHDLFAERPLEAADDASLPVPCRHVSFAGTYAEEVRREVEALRPSLVVYDTFAVIGPVVARLLGVPYVNVCAGHNVEPSRFLAELATDPRVNVSPSCHRAVETLKARHGIAEATPFWYAAALSPYLNLCCEPPQYLDPEERRPFEPLAFFGSLPSVEEIDERAVPAFGAAQFRVYVSFGTVVWRYYAAEAMRALVAVADAIAARPDARALISLGGAGVDGSALVRGNVAVEPYVDQRQVLAHADAYVTHHGLNSTHEAIFRRVPMISYPFFWDQPGLAEKCQRFGVAVPLADAPRAPVRPGDVARALDGLLSGREPMAAALSRARQWEIDVIQDRGAVLGRLAGLAQT